MAFALAEENLNSAFTSVHQPLSRLDTESAKTLVLSQFGAWHKATRHQEGSLHEDVTVIICHMPSEAHCWPLIIHGPLCFAHSFKSFLQRKVVFTTFAIKLCAGLRPENHTQFLLSSSPLLLSSTPEIQKRAGVCNGFHVFVHSVGDEVPNIPQGVFPWQEPIPYLKVDGPNEILSFAEMSKKKMWCISLA